MLHASKYERNFKIRNFQKIRSLVVEFREDNWADINFKANEHIVFALILTVVTIGIITNYWKGESIFLPDILFPEYVT